MSVKNKKQSRPRADRGDVLCKAFPATTVKPDTGAVTIDLASEIDVANVEPLPVYDVGLSVDAGPQEADGCRLVLVSLGDSVIFSEQLVEDDGIARRVWLKRYAKYYLPEVSPPFFMRNMVAAIRQPSCSLL